MRISSTSANAFELPVCVKFMIILNYVGIVVQPKQIFTNRFTTVASPLIVWKLHYLDMSALSPITEFLNFLLVLGSMEY